MGRFIRRATVSIAVAALALGGVALTTAPASAVDRTVTSTADDNTPGTLRFEIENSLPGDTILFDPTVFSSPQTIVLDDDHQNIVIPHSLTIVGPGSALLSLTRESNTFSYPMFEVIPGGGITAVDVALGGMGLDDAEVGSGSGPAFLSSAGALGRDFTFFDLIIEHQEEPLGNGAGISIEAAEDVSVSNVLFDANIAATGSAGGLYVINAESVTVTASGFILNEAGPLGAGGAALFENIAGALRIESSLFQGNTAANSGAVHINNVGELDIVGTVFVDNTAGGSGGAVGLADTVPSFLDIVDSSFVSNTAVINGGALAVTSVAGASFNQVGTVYFDNTAFGGDGGAVWIQDHPSGSLGWQEMTFVSNEADGFGGAVYFGTISNTVLLQTSTYYENIGGNEGHSIYVAAIDGVGSIRIYESTMNEGGSAGAAFAVNSNSADNGVAVEYSTIVAPTAFLLNSNTGEGVNTYYSILEGTVTFAVAGGGPEPIEALWSLISSVGNPGVVIGEGSLEGVTNMMLGPLQDNGGPTLTRMPLAGSPAIDAGDPDLAFAPDFDQRGTGFPRVINDILDIGAVETAAVVPAGPTLPPTGAAPSPVVTILAVLALLGGVFLVRRVRRVPA